MILFDRMKEYDYEQLVICQDRSIGLKAIICIHDTTLGPALGGCRMWKYSSERAAIDDALRLARGMTYKAAVSGLNLGGGKAVIIGDPKQNKSETLFRAFGRFIETLNGRYITAEDVGTGIEDMEWILCETRHVVGLSTFRNGSGDPSLVTSLGVYHGIRACANHTFGSDKLDGMTVAIQGAGHVGYHVAEYLAKEGAKIIVTDINRAASKRVAEKFNAQVVNPADIYKVKCDIFVPCALGGVLNNKTIPQLKCKIIAGAANNQLKKEKRDGPELRKRSICYAPDFVINAGGLINVADEIMGYNRERAMNKASTIYNSVTEILTIAKNENIPTYLAAERMAERRIEHIRGLNTIRVAPRQTSNSVSPISPSG